MKFLHMTDLHLADNDFPNHVAGQQEELWDLLEEVKELAVENRCEYLFFTGDLFDKKQPRLNSHGLVQRLIGYFQGLRTAGIVPIGIAGNHDMSSGGMLTLARQPFGVLAESGALWVPNEPILLGATQVTPLHYADAAEWDPEFYRTERVFSEARQHIVLVHGSLSSHAYDYPFPHVPYQVVPNEDGVAPVSLYLWGHIHDDHSYEQVNGSVFANAGSLCRRSREQQRDVYVTVGELDGTDVEVDKFTLTRASPWQMVFNEVVDDYTPITDPALAGLIADASDLFAFEQVDYASLLESFKPTLGMEVVTRAQQFLESAESAAR